MEPWTTKHYMPTCIQQTIVKNKTARKQIQFGHNRETMKFKQIQTHYKKRM